MSDITTQEKFTKFLKAFKEFHDLEESLRQLGVYIDESDFLYHFYTLTDLLLDELLTQEGQDYFFECYWKQDWEIEDCINEFEPYFIIK